MSVRSPVVTVRAVLLVCSSWTTVVGAQDVTVDAGVDPSVQHAESSARPSPGAADSAAHDPTAGEDASPLEAATAEDASGASVMRSESSAPPSDRDQPESTAVPTPSPNAGSVSEATLISPETPQQRPKQDTAKVTVPREEPVTRFEWVPLPVAAGSSSAGELLPALPRWAQGAIPTSVVALLLFWALAWAVSGARKHLPSQGVFPGVLRGAAFLLRLAFAGALLVLLARVFLPTAGGAYPWLLAAAAVAIGWSLRDVLPDLAAAVVIRFENRLHPGVWIAVGALEGVVERRAFRAVWLRDPHGDRVALPNRMLLSSALRLQDTSGAIHDVALCFKEGLGFKEASGFREGTEAAELRAAIVEAVVTSPYVARNAAATVRRDGTDPTVWRVRARLLHERYAMYFEGELFERVEEMLAAKQRGEEPASELLSGKRDSGRPEAGKSEGPETGAP